MCFLYSSEPHRFLIRQQREFWYMCFCTAPNPVKLIAKWLNVFWYMRAVQLWTPFICCFRRERSFGICIFDTALNPKGLHSGQGAEFLYMRICIAPNQILWEIVQWFCFVYVYLYSSEPIMGMFLLEGRFWYMRICTTPNQYSVSGYCEICFGIRVFVQLRTYSIRLRIP